MGQLPAGDLGPTSMGAPFTAAYVADVIGSRMNLRRLLCLLDRHEHSWVYGLSLGLPRPACRHCGKVRDDRARS